MLLATVAIWLVGVGPPETSKKEGGRCQKLPLPDLLVLPAPLFDCVALAPTHVMYVCDVPKWLFLKPTHSSSTDANQHYVPVTYMLVCS